METRPSIVWLSTPVPLHEDRQGTERVPRQVEHATLPVVLQDSQAIQPCVPYSLGSWPTRS